MEAIRESAVVSIDQAVQHARSQVNTRQTKGGAWEFYGPGAGDFAPVADSVGARRKLIRRQTLIALQRMGKLPASEHKCHELDRRLYRILDRLGRGVVPDLKEFILKHGLSSAAELDKQV